MVCVSKYVSAVYMFYQCVVLTPLLCPQYRAALLSLMVDIAVMLGAPQKAAQLQMEQVLAFEIKLAKVEKNTSRFNIVFGYI